LLQIECERRHIICERRKSVAYDLRMGDLLVRLLLRVTDAPTLKEMERMAGAAAEALLRLFPEPNSGGNKEAPCVLRQS
jgi:hypothetical protein